MTAKNPKPPKKPHGRPRVLGEAVTRRKFLKVLEELGSRNAAAGLCGFHKITVHREIARDDSFRADVDVAEACWLAKQLKVAQKSGDWRAVQWLVASKFQEFRHGAVMTSDQFDELLAQAVQCAREVFQGDAAKLQRFEDVLHEQIKMPTNREEDAKPATLSPETDVVNMGATVPSAPAEDAG